MRVDEDFGIGALDTSEKDIAEASRA